jgi:glutathione peroxidase-family protein
MIARGCCIRLLFLFGVGIMGWAQAGGSEMRTIYEFTMKDISGEAVSMEVYKGKVLLVVNVASRCGFTPQYAGLESLYQKHKDQGLVVLGFPANNFLWQEPGTDDEIKTFCTTKYNVTFPMFSKISVKGKDIHPLYQWLTSKETNPAHSGTISWNFNKFLIGRDGQVLARFGARQEPLSDEIQRAIHSALDQ